MNRLNEKGELPGKELLEEDSIEHWNFLIAEFMGLPTQGILVEHPETGEYVYPQELDYGWSFDWLIPVGKKILSNDFRYECLRKGFDPWMDMDYDLDNITEGKWEMSVLYPAIVEFIKWYNTRINEISDNKG